MVKGTTARTEKVEELNTKVHLSPAGIGGMYKKTSAAVYRITFYVRLRCKQDEAGPGCLDKAFLKNFNHGLVTEQLKKTVRDTNGEADEGRKRFATITDRLPPSGAEGGYEKKGPGLPVCSTKVPETTLKDPSVICKHSVRHEITDIKDLKTNDFKNSPTKSHDAENPDEPIKLAYGKKQDGAGTECQDDTVPRLLDYSYVTNGREELLSKTVTLPNWLLFIQKKRVT